MTRDDLFRALGMVDSQRLARFEKRMNPSLVIPWEDSNMKSNIYINRNRIKKIVLLAAIIALMLLLMGSAVYSLVTMQVKSIELHLQDGKKREILKVGTAEVQKEDLIESAQVFEGEMVSFEGTQDVFIALGTYYPQEIPEGFAVTFVSNDAPLQNQVIHYENDAGDMIKYRLYRGGPASNIEIYGIEKKTDVRINGQPGILYEQKGGGRTLVWVNKRQGFGFALQTDNTSVDLLAMAESTAEGEPLTPSYTEETKQALEELGDFAPAYLPEGYSELAVAGFPLSGDWYSYVRKWYVNQRENALIYFEYESYVIVTEDGYTDDARTVCSFHIPGYHILRNEVVGEEVTVGGMFGIADEEDIAWADPETHRVFHLHSEDITGSELLKVAQSMYEQ